MAKQLDKWACLDKPIATYYVWGSEGHNRFFFRPKGTRVNYYMNGKDHFFTQEKDEFVVQFDGWTTGQSAYHEYLFDTYDEGAEHFDKESYRNGPGA